MEASEDAEPRLLDHVVRRGGRADERPRDAAQAAVVAGHERLERALVTGAQTVEKHVVVVHHIVKLHTG